MISLSGNRYFSITRDSSIYSTSCCSPRLLWNKQVTRKKGEATWKPFLTKKMTCIWQEKNKGKKSRALMRTLIITKSGDAQEMALFYVCSVGCALLCTYTAEDIKYKDWRGGRRWLSDGEGMWPTLLSQSACVACCQAQWTLKRHMRG